MIMLKRDKKIKDTWKIFSPSVLHICASVVRVQGVINTVVLYVASSTASSLLD